LFNEIIQILMFVFPIHLLCKQRYKTSTFASKFVFMFFKHYFVKYV